MRTVFWLAASLCPVLLPACQPPGEPGAPAADVAAEAQAIRDVNAQWLAAVSARDAAATAAIYLPEGRLMPPNAVSALGSAAIAEFYRGIFELPNLSVSWTQDLVEVAESGTLAYDVGPYSLAYDGPSGRVEDRGKYLVVWKKVNGQWRVAAESFNSDLPLQ